MTIITDCKGYGIYEDDELKFGIFQGSELEAKQMIKGFKSAPLNRKLNLTLKRIEIIITMEENIDG